MTTPQEILAGRQGELVAALVAGGPDPAGFDAGLLAATRRSLLRKRAAEVATAWPMLAASFGDGWPAVFARHRGGHPPVGSARDGWDVARVVAGELSPAAAAELAGREAGWRYDGRSAPRRRRRARIRRWFRI